MFLAVLVGIFYFTLVRPQRRRAAEQKKMIEALAPGDEIVTVGGVYAVLMTVGERVLVRVAGGAEMEIAPQAIARVVVAAVVEEASDDEHGR